MIFYTYNLILDVLVEDVDECTEVSALLKSGCDNDAICTNTDGKVLISILYDISQPDNNMYQH